MDLTEKTTETSTVFTGKIVTVRVDTAQLPNGKLARREVVDHPGGVAILALDENQQVYLVRQYRYPISKTLIELPAGKLDAGEDPSVAAARELEEETGLRAGRWTALGSILASPGFCDEVLYMYLAQDLSRHESHPDEDEFLDVMTVPFSDLFNQVMSGEITDAKTVATTLKVKCLLNL